MIIDGKLLLPEGIEENFRFLALEVTKQVEGMLAALASGDREAITKIGMKDDYIDNLKAAIENKCFNAVQKAAGMEKHELTMIRAVNTVSGNLERIADHTESIASQMRYYDDTRFLHNYDYEEFFSIILEALREVPAALLTREVTTALQICRAEHHLDTLYKKNFDGIMGELRSGHAPENLITTVFVIRYLERMGDCLLNIGEAIIFTAVGERLKIHQFQALEDNLALSGFDLNIPNLAFEGIWEGKSGCRIGHLSARNSGTEGESSQEVIFKEGNSRKIQREKKAIEAWDKIMPGLPPRVFSFQNGGETASILLEYLNGHNLQQIILSGDNALIKATLDALFENLMKIWSLTKKDTPVKSAYLKQLFSRLNDVYAVHPYLREEPQKIGEIETATLKSLLVKASPMEAELASPYSVLIHGDFNIDNIIYSPAGKKIHFIDLHRSMDMDYVQDVSTFIVSNFRVPVFESASRKMFNSIALAMRRFASEWAATTGDATFERRLAFGLIRSFATSSRFVFNRDFAKVMFHRSVYLLEKVTEHEGKEWDTFKIPDEILIY
ncbi:MAG: phosphotransferase [Nitrospinae bacterium]|nr:phosphotransferase [Nitrospinota bacterium]